jgi:hypothetical protein
MTNGEDVPTGGAGGNGDQADTNRTADESTSERVRERVVSRECAACGQPVVYAGRGRPGRYCSAACRQHGWALRKAEQQLTTGADPRPRVVREVVERTTERVVVRRAPVTSYAVPVRASAAPAAPVRPRDWVRLLGELEGQLGDPAHPLARQHWDHPRLYAALVRAVTALGQAHPGGLDALASPQARRR